MGKNLEIARDPQALPTEQEARLLLNRLLLYWCAASVADQLFAGSVLDEVASLSYLEGCTRIVVASSQNGKKTRAIRSFFAEKGLNRMGKIPFSIESFDPEGKRKDRPRHGVFKKIVDEETGQIWYKMVEPSTNASAVVANWKTKETVAYLAGKEGGKALVIANDLTVYVGDEASGYSRLPNPERTKAAAEARGEQFTWDVIKQALYRIADVIAHEEGQPAKDAFILYNFVTAFSRQTLGPGEPENVVHTAGWAFKIGLRGLPRETLESDLEMAREQRAVGAMLKRPPLVPFAENIKYIQHMHRLDILPYLTRPDLTDDVGQPYTHDGSDRLIDPGYGPISFFRPELYQEDTNIIVRDALGIPHVIDNWEAARTILTEQNRIFSAVLHEILQFVVSGVPTKDVLLALLATLQVPTRGNAQEVMVPGYPELAVPIHGETPAEKQQRLSQSMLTINMGDRNLR